VTCLEVRSSDHALQTCCAPSVTGRAPSSHQTVMAITSQSLRSAVTVEDGRQAIEQRLIAFGRAHDLLLQANWKSAQLREILNKAIEPFDNETPSRFVIQSSNIETAASAAVPLAMAINELCTNAAKYGALSRPGACVEITAETDELRSQFCLRG
jgi:two-component sensor histidine kinase